MACVSMYVCVPQTMLCQGASGSPLHGLIDAGDGFPQCKWVIRFLSGGHTQCTVCAYVKCNEWAASWKECERSHLRSFYGCYASARVPFLENARLHLHSLKHTSCPFVSLRPAPAAGWSVSPSIVFVAADSLRPWLVIDNIRMSHIEMFMNNTVHHGEYLGQASFHVVKGQGW